MDLISSGMAARYSSAVSAATGSIFTPVLDWRMMDASDHFVQFYENDDSLVRSVGGFIGAGLSLGDYCLVIATSDHIAGVDGDLCRSGLDVDNARAGGHYVCLDAADALSEFMRDGLPDGALFFSTVGEIVARAASEGKKVRAFGEMVALLWSEGNHEGAVHLERLWNELAESHAFCMFCAYSMDGFNCQSHATPFAQICTHHSRVIPAESYSDLADPDKRLREISLLQQKAKALEAEIAQRKRVESVLTSRERELSDFFENAAEGLHKVGPDGVIQWANRAELGLLGYQSSEYVGRHISEFHADFEVIEAMRAKLLAGESLYDCPARMVCKDGSIKHVLINSNAYFEDGQFMYSRCFIRDITDRVVMEEALRAHMSEIEALSLRLKRSVTETHHRVKNNLQLVTALIEMQKQTARDMVPVEELNRLSQNIQALGIIHDILTRQSRDGEDSEVISAARVIERLLPVLQSTLGSRRLLSSVGEVMLPGKQTTAMAIITNELVSNAAKHGTGDIEVSLTLEHGTVALEVCDDGPGFCVGFAPETAAHIGLDLVENIARYDLQGTTSYENRREGGARARVTFSQPTSNCLHLHTSS